MTASVVAIRPATTADVGPIASLLGILFAQEKDFSPDIAKQRRGVERIISTPERGSILVAESAEGILGSCCLLWSESTFLGTAAAWLEDVIVHPDYRSRRIGKQLVQAAIATARERGCMRVNLLTDSDNTNAQRLYEKHGFKRSQMLLYRNYL